MSALLDRKSTVTGFKYLSSLPKLPVALFAVSIFAALILLWLSQLAVDAVAESNARIAHSQQTLGKLAHLQGAIEQMETVRRGHSISREETLLLPFNGAQRNVAAAFKALAELTADNDSQRERVALLKPPVDELMAMGRREFNTRAVDPGQAAGTLAHARLLIEQSRELIGTLSVEERTLLEVRMHEGDARLKSLRLWLAGIGLVAVGLLTYAFLMSRNETRRRRLAEERLRESEAENKATVHNLSLIGEMTGLLQACADTDESLDVICQYAERLLRMDSGGLYLFRESRSQIELTGHWGADSRSEVVFDSDHCWALRRGELHILDGVDHALACRHLHDWDDVSSLCVPIVAQGNVLGILHVERHHGRITPAEVSLANNLATQIALAMASVKLRDTLRNLSVRDPLTGLFNRRYMEESLQREIATAQRKNRPLAVVILDLDYFKKFNDTFGHETGDFLLREVGGLLSRKSRIGDIACRFGGEEFVLIYPEAEQTIAIQLAQQLREAIHDLNLQHFGRDLGQISASLGLAFYPLNGSTADQLLRAADKALYEAKGAGRNRVEIAKSS
ncbi:MAG TPA: diguanylate cyclase [Methylophilaceae bacterium]|nr:diguanylate cyclase [Methylophilaceae bacterium]